MKRFFTKSGSWVRPFAVLSAALIFPIVGVLMLSWRSAPVSHAQDEADTAYLPAQMAPAPTPTPAPPPQFVKNVPLPYAQCPNAAGFNRVSGYMFIPNIYSDNVSVFRDQAFVVDLYTGEWPRGVASDPNSSRTWVTNLHTGTALIEGTTQSGLVPREYEPYGVAYNPVNGYVYVTDLNGKVQVINGAELVATLDIVDPTTGKGGGWLLAIVIDPHTGLVYVASWEYGRLYVIKGTDVIASVQLGGGPVNMALDDVRGLIYVAHAMPNETYPHDISVIDVDSLSVSFVASVPGQKSIAQDVAVDMKSGLAYVTHPKQDSVIVMKGTSVVARIPVGDQPWAVGVNPNDGYAFVTNRGSESVSILRNGALMETVGVQGEEPWAVGVDTNNNDIYIANRGRRIGTAACKNASVTIMH